MSYLEEQLGVASSGKCWDVAEVRLYESTQPNVLLYAVRGLTLARDDQGRYRAAISQFQSWQDGAYRSTGGSAMLTLAADGLTDPLALEQQRNAWRLALAAQGYPGSAEPRFFPLPTRELRLHVQCDPSQGRPLGEGGQELLSLGSQTILLDLTPAGAEQWAQAVVERSNVAGSVRLTFQYPQMIPSATANVRIYGRRIFDHFLAEFALSQDGRATATSEAIRATWTQLLKIGAIEIDVTGAATSDEFHDLAASFADQALERLFGTLFVPLVEQIAPATGAKYSLRWRRHDEAVDLTLKLQCEGWTWVDSSADAAFANLLRPLDPSFVSVVYQEVAVPVTLVVEGDPMLLQAAVSMDFGESHLPETRTYGKAGGVEQFVVRSSRPASVPVRYKARVTLTPPKWPVVDVAGTATISPGGPRIVLQPSNWIRTHTVYLYVRKGDRILRQDEIDAADYLALTATYQAPYLPEGLMLSARITPQSPVSFRYPRPPGSSQGQAQLSAMGMIAGQMVRSPALTLDEAEDSIFLLAGQGQVQLVGRQSVVPETDKLVQRLRVAGARPVLTTSGGSGPRPEAGIDIAYDVVLVPQPTGVSCWAAALTMVVSYRDSACYDPWTIAGQAGMDLNTGYAWPSIRQAVAAWDLVEEGPRSAMPEEWERMLRLWGPIWIVEIGAPYHAVVLTGIQGDGTPEGTVATLHNPWPPNQGAIELKSFLDFDREFGLGAGAGAAMVRAR